jgi:hypothetical protein
MVSRNEMSRVEKREFMVVTSGERLTKEGPARENDLV